MNVRKLLERHVVALHAFGLIRETTQVSYRRTIERLPPSLLGMEADKVTATDIELALADMRKTFGVGTINLSRSLLAGAFRRAVVDRMLDHNPAREARLARDLKRTKKRAKALTDAQVRAAFAVAAQDARYGFLFRFALGTGMRRGELCALDWADMGIVTGTVRVDKTAVEYGKVWSDAPPKTAAGHREIILPVGLADEVRAIYVARGKPTEGPVFQGESGGRLRPTVASRAIGRILAKAGAAQLSLHSLRHTHLSHLVASGAPLPAVAARAGHSDPRTTLGLYAHSQASEDRVLAQIADRHYVAAVAKINQEDKP